MAYMNQELKKQRAPQIKKVLKKYGLKGTIGVRNYSTLYVTIKEGALDFIGAAQKINDEYARRHFREVHKITDGYLQVNENRGDDYREYDKKVGDFIDEMNAAMKGVGYYNNDDAMIDYFDRAFYVSINVGTWQKPYVYTGA